MASRHNKRDISFIKISSVLVGVTILSAAIAFAVEDSSTDPLDRTLNAMGIAGFVGMLAQFILALVQEYLDRSAAKVSFIYKDSAFSNSILNGIRDSLSRESGIELTPFPLSSDLEDQEINREIVNILRNDSRRYDYIVMRMPSPHQNIFQACKDLPKSKKLILVDVNFGPHELEELSKKACPIFIGSNFREGGSLAAEEILSILNASGNRSTAILLLGPKDKPSSRKRTKSLIYDVALAGQTNRCITIELKTYNPTDALNLIEDKLDTIRIPVEERVVVFAGNDNILNAVMEEARRSEGRYSNIKSLYRNNDVATIGYDGIAGTLHPYLIDSYDYACATIDVQPKEQGKKVAKVINGFVTSDSEQESVILVKPKFVENTAYKQIRNEDEKRIFSIDSIADYTKEQKLLIFDFDGTIADTEPLHAKSYQSLLEKDYGIDFTEDDFQKYIGTKELDIWQALINDYELKDANVSELMDQREELYLANALNSLSPFPYVTQLLKDFDGPFVIVSSQKESIINRLLRKWNLEDRFRGNIFTAENEETDKDELLARIINDFSNKHDITHEQITLFEDSEKYLSLGKECGVQTIGIETSTNEGKIESADYIYVIPKTSDGGVCP